MLVLVLVLVLMLVLVVLPSVEPCLLCMKRCLLSGPLPCEGLSALALLIGDAETSTKPSSKFTGASVAGL